MLKSNPQRILVFRIGELGDTIVALPALSAIRRAFPSAHLTLLGNVDAEARHVTPDQVLPQGLFDEWLSYRSRDFRSKLSDRLKLLRRLRSRRFDLLVYLAPRIRSRADVRRDLLFFRLAGVSKVIGADAWQLLPSRNGRSLPNVEHETDHLLQRLSRHGIRVPEVGTARFELDLSANEQQRAGLWLKKNLPAERITGVIGFGAGSKWPSKVWPEERFAELGSRLVEFANMFPIVFGGREDRAIGDRLIQAWGRGANAAGALSVREAAAALKSCDAYVGNDTGTMHLAASVGTRCVAIMAAVDWPGRWNPYGSDHLVLRREVQCEGCLLRVCEREGMKCLKEISVDDVFAACCQLLEDSSSGSSLAIVERRAFAEETQNL
jgi:lipopolysaccharide heptosyltransferase III